ncbi:hypothetical protein Tco_0316717 [Tanacetum coccineum]
MTYGLNIWLTMSDQIHAVALASSLHYQMMLEKSNPLIFVKGAGKTQVYYKGSNHLLCSFLFLYDDVVHDACLIKIDPGNPPPSEPVNSQHGIKSQGIKQHNKSCFNHHSRIKPAFSLTQPWMLFEEERDHQEKIEQSWKKVSNRRRNHDATELKKKDLISVQFGQYFGELAEDPTKQQGHYRFLQKKGRRRRLQRTTICILWEGGLKISRLKKASTEQEDWKKQRLTD